MALSRMNDVDLTDLVILLSEIEEKKNSNDALSLDKIVTINNTLNVSRRELAAQAARVADSFIKLGELSEKLKADVLTSMKSKSPEELIATYKAATQSYLKVHAQAEFQGANKIKSAPSTDVLKTELIKLKEEINKLSNAKYKNACSKIYVEQEKLVELAETLCAAATKAKSLAVPSYTLAVTKMTELKNVIAKKPENQEQKEPEQPKPQQPAQPNRYNAAIHREASQVKPAAAPQPNPKANEAVGFKK